MPGFPETILIVDDDEDLLTLQEEALKRVGDIAIHKSNSYDLAKEYLTTTKPDIVLLDLRMPGKDGTVVLADMRKLEGCENIPVIFVTGETQVLMQDSYYKLGVLGVIHKPFKPSAYITTIQQLWQKQRFQGEKTTK
jgi:DNA-binding NtrC family response regulator